MDSRASLVHSCNANKKQPKSSQRFTFLRKATLFCSGFLKLIMDEKNPPLESELAAAMADVVMDEDHEDQPFVKRFGTPDEIVHYWEHQLEKVNKILIC